MCCKHTCIKFIRDSVPRVFTGGRSRSHCLSGKCPNSRLSKGKQVFNLTHIICSRSLGTVRCSNPLMLGTLLKFKLPAASQVPVLEAGLPEHSSPIFHVNFSAHPNTHNWIENVNEKQPKLLP